MRTWCVVVLVLGAAVCAGCRTGGATHGNDGVAYQGPTAPAPWHFTLARTGLPEAGNWKCDPVLADVNHDGWLDLAATVRLGTQPMIWLGSPSGAWTPAAAGLELPNKPCGGGVDVGDVNNDGLADVVVADHCRGIFVYLGQADGGWKLVRGALFPAELLADRSIDSEFTGAEDVALGDVNGDGNLDIVAGGSDVGGGISVYAGDGDGVGWTLLQTGLPTAGIVNRVALADIDGDGTLDYLAALHTGPRVWLNDGAGGAREASVGLPAPPRGGLYNGLAVGDVNEDGRLDFATANWVDGPVVYVQDEHGAWEKTPDAFPDMFGGSYGVALADLDGDGHLDLVVSGRLTREVGYVYGVFTLRGDGTGHWVWTPECGLPSSGLPFTYGVTVGDVNEDGVRDIVAASGGIVATSRTHAQPTVPAGMLVWLGRPAAQP